MIFAILRIWYGKDSIRSGSSEVKMAEICEIKTTSRTAKLNNYFENNVGHLRKYLEETFSNLNCDIFIPLQRV